MEDLWLTVDIACNIKTQPVLAIRSKSHICLRLGEVYSKHDTHVVIS